MLVLESFHFNLKFSGNSIPLVPVIVPPAKGKNGPPAPPPLEAVMFPEASVTKVPAP